MLSFTTSLNSFGLIPNWSLNSLLNVLRLENPASVYIFSIESTSVFQIKRDIEELQLPINLILGKLLTTNNSDIESSLNYITIWIWNRTDQFINLYNDQIILLIRKYADFNSYPKELDKLYMIKYISQIAIILKEYGTLDEEERLIVSNVIQKSLDLNFNVINKVISNTERKHKKN